MSQKTLAVVLSKLDVFENPKQNLEQYPTDSEIGAQSIWKANLMDWINGKIIVDLGAGTGVLGIGCILMGAKKVFFVEKDLGAIEILKRNLSKLSEEYEIGEYEIIHRDIRFFYDKSDLVIMNPPFGTQIVGADMVFLKKAMDLAPRIITFNKSETSEFIDKQIHESEFTVVRRIETKFPIKKTLEHHKKRIERIKVTVRFLQR